MRVLLVNDCARVHNGGMNRVVVETCRWLTRAGHEVGLAYQDGGAVEVATPVFPLPDGGPPGALEAVLEKFQPDVVQVHFARRAEMLPALARRVPVCVFLHDQTWFCPSGDRMDRDFNPCHRPHGPGCLFWNYAQGCGGKNPVGNWQRWRRTESLAGLQRLPQIRLQVASRFMRAGLSENGYDLARVDVVPLFAEPPPAEDSVEPGLLFLPSRLVPGKGVHVAIEAMTQLPALPGRLVIAGNGDQRAELEAQTARLGLGDRVQFLGELPPAELAHWYARAQVVLFPVLRQEPFGLIGVESLAYGKPIVAFGGGAVDEWLWPGETGLRVEQRTSVDFAAAVRTLLTDPARCRAMGAAARQRYPLFHPTAYIERLVAAFAGTIRWHAAARAGAAA